jgi:hypothetical protein
MNDDIVAAPACPFAAPRTHLPIGLQHLTRIVVGDRLKQHLHDERFVTVDEARRLLRSHLGGRKLALHIGQGATDDDILSIYGLRAATALSEVRMVPPRWPAKASRALTHKHEPVNVLISEPTAAGDGSYVSRLTIDERCADMSDHLTGVHVPGMVVAEAARQMMIAVNERFHLPHRPVGALRFVTHSMEARYEEFLAPMEAQIRCVPITLRRVGKAGMRTTCEVIFHQGQKQAATVRFDCSVIDSVYLEREEFARVERLADALCSGL